MRCESLNCQKLQLGTKSPVKPTWSKKMNVLSTFLVSSINFISNRMKNTTKCGTVSEENGVKIYQ